MSLPEIAHRLRVGSQPSASASTAYTILPPSVGLSSPPTVMFVLASGLLCSTDPVPDCPPSSRPHADPNRITISTTAAALDQSGCLELCSTVVRLFGGEGSISCG